ncbi:MAG: polysaccharide deacetylase family protein [Chloroflexia bacterium]
MSRGKVTVLAYHRIDTPGNPATRDLSPALIDAYPAEFEAQMRWLAGKFNVIPGWQLVESLRDHKPLPPRALMITFDDGYTCFMETAVPILRRYGLPATLFVATDYTSNPHKPFWWDTLHRVLAHTQRVEIEVPGAGRIPLSTGEQRAAAYETLVGVVERASAEDTERLVKTMAHACGVEPTSEKHRLDWDEVRALSEAGDISIGPHTRRHPILSRTTSQRMADEIEGSWADLNSRLARPLPLFAYPNGQAHAISRANVGMVREAGMPGAFTMMPGHNFPGRTNPYMMYRIGATPGLSLNRFKLRISPLGSLLRRTKSLLRMQKTTSP